VGLEKMESGDMEAEVGYEVLLEEEEEGDGSVV